MKNRIIYKNKDNTVAVLMPAQEVLDTVGLQAIAEKDTPQELPYWLTTADQIPSDRSQRDAWEIDESMGDPDGFGGESNEFSDEDLLKLHKAGLVE